MISLNSLPENTKKLFHALAVQNQQDGILSDFLLIGGTALAMQIEHRQSEDLDFATGKSKLPKHKIEKLLGRLEEEGMEVVDITDPGARDDFINDGYEIEDYQQDWLVDGTKLTFFTYGKNPYESDVISNSTYQSLESIKIASLDTIAKTKCHTLTRRMKSRDLFDVYYLIQSGHLTVEKVVAEMQKSNRHMTFETCVDRILEKPMQANDEGLVPIGVDISVQEIRDYLTPKVAELEQAITSDYLSRRTQ